MPRCRGGINVAFCPPSKGSEASPTGEADKSRRIRSKRLRSEKVRVALPFKACRTLSAWAPLSAKRASSRLAQCLENDGLAAFESRSSKGVASTQRAVSSDEVVQQ